MFLVEKNGYRMRRPGQRRTKRAHRMFIDDLKVYQQDHQKLQVANEISVKASTDISACCGVKKCVDVVYNAVMIKGERLTVLEEKMKVLEPEQNEVYKFRGCEQADKTEMKKIMERG